MSESKQFLNIIRIFDPDQQTELIEIMKQYNFDEIIERRGTNCVKYDLLKKDFGNENLVPLWVADMDFRTPDFIVNAIKKRLEHEIFGYTFDSDSYYNSIIEWVHYKHNWKIQREWLSYIPGIVKGIGFVLQCFTKPGDKVIIQPPVYHPFRIVPENMHREVVYNPLKTVDDIYEMDFENLESVIDEHCKVLILCNPHNPGGVVWKKDTLVKLAEVCAKHNILVISDEIHAEMAYPQYTHHPFATVSETATNCSITFMNFCKIYADLLPPETLEELRQVNGAVEQLDYLYQACERAGQKMYLFIDEYDHFTNAILSDAKSLHRYTDETHGEGYLRAFFNKVKAGTYSSIERCFITGVSPVTMDDLTSGFNIGTNYSLTPQFNQMMGFTEEEVREMLTYYSTNSPFRHTVDELIEIMKPWYDNYCFAQDCYGETTMYNSNMVLYFVKNYIDNGKAPREMIEDNIRIDYEKLRMLIRKDKEFAHDASVIQTLVSQGYITGELKKGFPAVNITNPDNFISLLYYFGMLTISGMHEGKTKLTIPNLVVQEQLYTYLLNTYNDADLSFSSYEKSELSSQLAYRGNWQAYFSYIADCLKRYASQRDKQKGEFFVHGFTLAMTAQNRFYRPISEQDTQAGYVDIFLCPMLDIYSDMKHSYIVELKYAKYRDSENRVEELRQEAIAQANRYADTDTVKQAIGSTQLHKIVVVYKGMEMRVCEEL